MVTEEDFDKKMDTYEHQSTVMSSLIMMMSSHMADLQKLFYGLWGLLLWYRPAGFTTEGGDNTMSEIREATDHKIFKWSTKIDCDRKSDRGQWR